MGHIISAVCTCGYQEENIIVGAGREDFLDVCMQPAFCEQGSHLVSADIKGRHASCSLHGGSKLAFYFEDEHLQASPGDNIISAWQGREINDGLYLCPRCHAFELRFQFPHIHFDGAVSEISLRLSDERHAESAEDDLEEFQIYKEIEEVAEPAGLTDNAISLAMTRCIGRSLQLDRSDFELVFLTTAERERFDGRTSHADHYMSVYRSFRDVRITSSLYQIISENRFALETAAKESRSALERLAFDVFTSGASYNLDRSDFDQVRIRESIESRRSELEASRLAAESIDKLKNIVTQERELGELLWWLTAWRTVQTFFQSGRTDTKSRQPYQDKQTEVGLAVPTQARDHSHPDMRMFEYLGSMAPGMIESASYSNDLDVAMTGAIHLMSMIGDAKDVFQLEVQEGAVLSDYLNAAEHHDFATMAAMIRSFAAQLEAAHDLELRGAMMYFWFSEE